MPFFGKKSQTFPLTFPLTGADLPPEGSPLTYPLTLAKPDSDPFFESFLTPF